MIRILFLGDVVGEPGREAVKRELLRVQKDGLADFVIVNGENAAGGRGISGRLAIELLRAGAAVITTGDHVWDQKDTAEYIRTEPRLLRPVNCPPGAPGQGSIVLETSRGRVAVMNVQGRTFMPQQLDNPFPAALAEAERLRAETPVIFVDMHAEATSEKIALAHFLDGQVSAVVGTHTHVQTADERILPGGTAFLCDAGMCGPEHSILGRDPKNIIRRFLNAMPATFPVAGGPVRVSGALVEVDEATGRALAIRRISRLVGAEE
ncbi:MAG: TIGR00282 family metallophosphoesterase [Terrimicrobiaceae bacterium]|nr:TIGR00282 family metallophosphoesterase [Terrimicrobiaceae bacterium]